MGLPENLRELFQQMLDIEKVLYDRQGNRITAAERLAELRMDPEYQFVAQEAVGPYWVSTIWLFGHDHNWSRQGPPTLFETMVFGGDGSTDSTTWGGLEQRRWSTEAEAIAGHAEIVALVRATLLDPPDTLEGEL